MARRSKVMRLVVLDHFPGEVPGEDYRAGIVRWQHGASIAADLNVVYAEGLCEQPACAFCQALTDRIVSRSANRLMLVRTAKAVASATEEAR